MISAIGNDQAGHDIRDIFRQQQFDAAYLQVIDGVQTGYVLATEVQPNEMQYEIVEDVAWDKIQTTAENTALADQSPYFVFGSLAARAITSNETLFALLEKATCAVFDVNLRFPFYSPDLIFSLLAKTHILKINEKELELLAGWTGITGDTPALLAALSRKYALPEILLTRGEHGAAVYAAGIYQTVDGIQTTVADTVGSGDAFLAGYLYARTRGASMHERLTAANQLAAWVTRSYGACPPYGHSILQHINQLLTTKTAES